MAGWWWGQGEEGGEGVQALIFVCGWLLACLLSCIYTFFFPFRDELIYINDLSPQRTHYSETPRRAPIRSIEQPPSSRQYLSNQTTTTTTSRRSSFDFHLCSIASKAIFEGRIHCSNKAHFYFLILFLFLTFDSRYMIIDGWEMACICTLVLGLSKAEFIIIIHH